MNRRLVSQLVVTFLLTLPAGSSSAQTLVRLDRMDLLLYRDSSGQTQRADSTEDWEDRVPQCWRECNK